MSKIVDTAILATQVVGETKDLFELQLRLLRAEIQEFSTFSKQMALYGALALAALLPAGFFLGLSLSSGFESLTGLPMWSCQLLVFLVLVLASVVPILKARSLVKARKE